MAIAPASAEKIARCRIIHHQQFFPPSISGSIATEGICGMMFIVHLVQLIKCLPKNILS
jgi:hypothetical protein